MRWGVRDEATDDHMTTELCMREIANCQRLSMGPNFVVSMTAVRKTLRKFKKSKDGCKILHLAGFNNRRFVFCFVVVFFKVFLGQKYGYRPISTYILSSELQSLRDELASTGSDVTLLDTWYKKDSNAVPPVSVLQPISSILVNFNNKVSWVFGVRTIGNKH